MKNLSAANWKWPVMNAVMAIAVLCGNSLAAPLIEDPFDYEVGTLHGNNGGTGWAGSWTVNLQPAITSGSIEVIEGSLAFSDYATTGNRVNLEAVSGTAFSGLEGIRPIGKSVESGDLWASFLYRRTDDQTGISTISRTNEVRINSPAIHFGMKAKGPSSQGIRVRYDTTDGPASAATSVQDGETYLMVGRFTNLGTDDLSGVATMWALTADDYDSIKFGGVTPEELDSAATLIAIDDTINDEPRTLQIGDNLWILNYTSSYSSSYDLDELRYGTSLADVVPGSEAQPLFGDYNGDNVVDAADYTMWRNHLGEANEDNINNNGDGLAGVDSNDYELWKTNYGASLAGAGGITELGGAAVPEPASWMSIALAIGAIIGSRRGHLAPQRRRGH